MLKTTNVTASGKPPCTRVGTHTAPAQHHGRHRRPVEMDPRVVHAIYVLAAVVESVVRRLWSALTDWDPVPKIEADEQSALRERLRSTTDEFVIFKLGSVR